MIEKDPGIPNINRLRIIHLFEADYNFVLKLLWGSRLVKRAVAMDLLHHCQHGSVPGHTTMDAIMLTQLSTDLCRLSKINLARFDNDASACYDRIIVALAMLAARRCGMPDHAISTHADALQFMQYTVKTIHGVSDENYQGTPFEPLFGTGQGSGASPAAWLSLVVLLMRTLDHIIPERMTFEAPDLHHSRLMDAFVDDTSLGFTDYGVLTCPEMITTLQTIAQTWEQLLFHSGGSLNLKKCSWYILYWEWKDGRPILRPVQPDDPTISLTKGASSTPLPVDCLPSDQASKILGVHLSPLGDFSKHLAVMKIKADTYAIRIRSPKLTASDIRVFHRSIYRPAMLYSLPSIAVDEEAYGPVQSKILASILNGIGVARTIPTAIRHGPESMGGLALIDLRTEAGIAALKLLRDSVFSMSETGKMIMINLYHSQRESGIGTPLLERPDLSVSYLTPTWLTSIRQFAYQHNIRISTTTQYAPTLNHVNDKFLMETPHLDRFTQSEIVDINLVRIHLQASTLSDISAGTDGRTICPHCYKGDRPPSFQPKPHWPRQPPPTNAQSKIWSSFLSVVYLRYGIFWDTPLGLRLPTIPLKLDPLATRLDPYEYKTLSSFIAAIPPFFRRLLHHHEQIASDKVLWRAFRSKSRLEIVTDGSLATNIGTFGWRLLRPPPIPFSSRAPAPSTARSNSLRPPEANSEASLLLSSWLLLFLGSGDSPIVANSAGS